MVKEIQTFADFVLESAFINEAKFNFSKINSILKKEGIKFGVHYKINKAKTGFIATDEDEAEKIIDTLAGTSIYADLNGNEVVFECYDCDSESESVEKVQAEPNNIHFVDTPTNALQPRTIGKLDYMNYDLYDYSDIMDVLNIVSESETFTEDNKKAYGDLVIIDADGKILLLRRGTNDWSPLTWGLAGGKLKLGEAPEVGALREATEESGLKELNGIDPNVLQFETIFGNKDGSTSHYYSLKLPMSAPKVNLSDEHIEGKWFTWDELKKLDLMFDLGDRLGKILGNKYVSTRKMKAKLVSEAKEDSPTLNQQKAIKAIEKSVPKAHVILQDGMVRVTNIYSLGKDISKLLDTIDKHQNMKSINGVGEIKLLNESEDTFNNEIDAIFESAEMNIVGLLATIKKSKRASWKTWLTALDGFGMSQSQMKDFVCKCGYGKSAANKIVGKYVTNEIEHIDKILNEEK